MRLLAKAVVIVVIFVAQQAVAQSPDAALSKLPQDMRDWVNRSCTRSLGPSLWSHCVVREASAAFRGKPDLSGLKPELQSWVMRSCPDSLGPSLAINCLTRERTALVNARLNLSSLNEQQKQWLLSSCPQSLGPSLFISCAQRESAALRGTQSVPPPKQYANKPLPRSRRFSSSGCEAGHWVDSVSNDGQIVKLEDGSIWEVDAVDAIDSALWLPTTDIVACDDKLINTEDNETVSATRLR